MAQGGRGGGDAEITSPLLSPIFQPLPTPFLASFHEFLKIHQREVRRRERDVPMKQAGVGGGEGGMCSLGPLSQSLLLSFSSETGFLSVCLCLTLTSPSCLTGP